MKRPPRHGIIYFVEPVDLDGPIKIGFSQQAEARLGALSSASPIALRLIGALHASNDDEQFLHRCFADAHSHGEWFYATDLLRSTIEGILQHGIQFARDTLIEKGPSKPWSYVPKSSEARAKQAAAMRKSWAERNARKEQALLALRDGVSACPEFYGERSKSPEQSSAASCKALHKRADRRSGSSARPFGLSRRQKSLPPARGVLSVPPPTRFPESANRQRSPSWPF